MHKIFSDNLANKDKHLTTYLNLYSYMLARENKVLFKHFNILVDGIIFVWILKAFGFLRVKRRSFDMTSMAPEVFTEAILHNESIYFIGTEPKIIDKAVKNIKAEFPNLNVCGYRDGYIKNPKEQEEVIAEIQELKTDIVICGMGTPLQEQFLLDLSKNGWKGKGYTCGGFLHQTADNLQYYPKWIDVLNLRGFYRMYDEPYLIKRYFVWYPWALVQYSFDSYRYNVYKKNNSIEVALKSADKAKEAMASLNADNRRILTKAKNERNLLLKEAREIQENILSEAKESKKQIKKAKTNRKVKNK